jgi:hypothetical protein
MSSVEWSTYVRDRLGVEMEPEAISAAVELAALVLDSLEELTQERSRRLRGD